MFFMFIYIARYFQAFGHRITGGDVNFLADLVKSGSMGRKTSRGLYVYHKGSKQKEINQDAMTSLKEKYSLESKGANSKEDMQMRMVTRYNYFVLNFIICFEENTYFFLFRFVNEAVLCLEEQILANPLEGDIGAVFGLGFPPFTGGPFRYVGIIIFCNF